jgi:hypothetical protein
MKKCPYCGAEYSDELDVCPVDQTPFDDGRVEALEARVRIANVLRWTPASAFGLAFTSGLAAILICTGIYYGGGKIMADTSGIWKHRAGDIAAPHRLGLFVFSATGNPGHTITWRSYISLFCLGALIFTFFVCCNRCQKKLHGVITATVALSVIVLLTFMPLFVPRAVSLLWLVPLVLIVIITKLSAGIYIAGAFQVLAGMWLLSWFRQRGSPNYSVERMAAGRGRLRIRALGVRRHRSPSR